MSHQRVQCSFVKIFTFCLFLCLGGGWLTGLLTEHGMKDWYPHLMKSALTPPDFVFPIVWTILYVFMALSLTLLWSSNTKGKAKAFLFFGIQLFLNFIWSWLFFYLERPDYALVDVICLWIFVFLTIISFWRHTILGASLLLPYLAWITLAAYLNLFIWFYN